MMDYDLNNDFPMRKFLNDVDKLGRTGMFIQTTLALTKKPILIISDYRRFLDNEDQIQADLAQWGGIQTGMTITFDDPKQVTMFLLKWI